MRGILILVFFLLNTVCIYSQTNEEERVKDAIISFFKAFHQQDSVAIKRLVSPGIIMQSIGKNEEGHEVLKTSDFHKFLKSIVGIPKTTHFKEKILSYTIQIDGSMAHVWTPYEFWINESLSHCGVNSFQLIKKLGVWEIIYLIDTRRKEKCL